MNLIDVHFHIDQYQNYKEIIASIDDDGNYYLCVTNNIDIFESLYYFYNKSKNIRFALGFNPRIHNSNKFSIYRFLYNIRKTRYIGEIGLDFTKRYVSSRENQLKTFNLILNAVKCTDKILSVHCNGAERETYELLKKYNLGQQTIIHWYSGGIENCKLLSSIGCYFSINGEMAKKKNFMNLISLIGVDHILIESDGPHTVLSKGYNDTTIQSIYDYVNSFLRVEKIEDVVYANFKRLLITTRFDIQK